VAAMKIEYDLTAEDWAALGEHCARTAAECRHARRNSVALGVIVVVVVSILLWLTTASLTMVVTAAAGGLFGALFWPNSIVSQAREQMVRRERPCLTGPHVLEATARGLIAKCDVTESITRWAGVHRVDETTRHVFVMLNDVQGFVVPKARIRGGDLVKFVSDAQRYASASCRAAAQR
jgi:t-SNARE complex subunit (syntaxin)